jgi:hypothetical protein
MSPFKGKMETYKVIAPFLYVLPCFIKKKMILWDHYAVHVHASMLHMYHYSYLKFLPACWISTKFGMKVMLLETIQTLCVYDCLKSCKSIVVVTLGPWVPHAEIIYGTDCKTSNICYSKCFCGLYHMRVSSEFKFYCVIAVKFSNILPSSLGHRQLGYILDDQGIVVWFLNVSFPQNIHIVCGTHRAHYPLGGGCCFPMTKVGRVWS